MRVVVVARDDDGNVDLDDLRAKVDEHATTWPRSMVTYPSTHGVFEETITELCALVHDAGGQVYVDGANLNALVGLAKPGRFGADVSHLNLHKTFCIPHGGGGPGVGPVAVRAHLAPYLPNHPLVAEAGPPTGVGPVASAPWGSAGILPISWAYVRLMGGDGLTEATAGRDPVGATTWRRGWRRTTRCSTPGAAAWSRTSASSTCADSPRTTGVTVDDVAKRLIDYGFHAPTMSFPVAGHADDRADRERGPARARPVLRRDDRDPRRDRPGRRRGVAVERQPAAQRAAHRASRSPASGTHPYSREEAAFPVGSLRRDKYWPPVRRIDGAYGDRNLVCACPPPEAFA